MLGILADEVIKAERAGIEPAGPKTASASRSRIHLHALALDAFMLSERVPTTPPFR